MSRKIDSDLEKVPFFALTHMSIERSEMRYRRLFEAAPDGILLLNPETGKIIDANPFLYQLLGYPPDSLLGKELWEIGVFEDQAANRSAFQELQDVGYIRYEDLPLEAAGGARREVEFVSNLYVEGDSKVIQCNIRDNTEGNRRRNALVESEYRLRLALECGEFGVWELDIDSNEFLSVTPKINEMFGLLPDAELSWKECLSLIEADDLVGVREQISSVILARSTANFEYRVNRRDGSVAWLHSFGGPTFTRHGVLDRIIGVTQDITDRKQREQERESALLEARYRASHDPLTGVLNHGAFYNRLDNALVEAERDGRPLALAIVDLENFKFFNDAYGHRAGDDVLRSVAYRLQNTCRQSDALGRFGGDEFAILFTEIDTPDCEPETLAMRFEASMTERLRELDYHPPDSVSGIPITVALGVSVWRPDRASGIDAAASQRLFVEEADERLRRVKTGAEMQGEAYRIRHATGRQVKGFPMLDGLVASVENKDRYTRRHSEDVMRYSLLIARELGMDETVQETIAIAALVHDVGKIGVPDAILRKPGRLTEAEFDMVRQHPPMGAIIVSAVPGLEGTIDAVRHHHERWDGHGYPAGLAGEAIPLMARLMSVADAFSAMTTTRPYRRGLEPDKAIKILRDGAGTQWDPQSVAALLSALAKADVSPIYA